MSLIYCPECGHEISANAIACPNCGRPIKPVQAPAVPIVEKKAVVTTLPREGGFPSWAFIPIGLLALILLIVAYVALRQNDNTANTNINVNMAARHPVTEPTRDIESRTVTVPPSGETAPVTVPGQSVTTQQQTIPSTTTSAPVAPPPTKGTVVINARVAPRSGSPQPARNTKFYLLDKDLESILSEARVEPVEGNSVSGSLGLAAVFPDRFGDFQKAAMRAIAKHVKYSGTTDGSGKAALKEVSPDNYYLFAITRIGHGFVMWDSPVNVTTGENVMELSPESVTEVEDPNG
jgi:hypothetical protein